MEQQAKELSIEQVKKIDERTDQLVKLYNVFHY
jgi:hypothetical protein